MEDVSRDPCGVGRQPAVTKKHGVTIGGKGVVVPHVNARKDERSAIGRKKLWREREIRFGKPVVGGSNQNGTSRCGG